jgi:hypothetical protein
MRRATNVGYSVGQPIPNPPHAIRTLPLQDAHLQPWLLSGGPRAGIRGLSRTDVDLPIRNFIKFIRFLNKTLISQRSLFPVSNLEWAALQCYPIIRLFVGKGHRVNKNVKVSLTFVTAIMRKMVISSTIARNILSTAPGLSITGTDIHRNVLLVFGDMQKNPKLKLGNNF